MLLRRLAPLLLHPTASLRPISTLPITPADPKTIQWGKIGFGYVPTRAIALVEYDGNKWSEVEAQQDPNLSIHCLSNVLHYGQALFEGLKVRPRCRFCIIAVPFFLSSFRHFVID